MRTLVLGIGRLDSGQTRALDSLARRRDGVVFEVRVPLSGASAEEVLADCLDLQLRVRTSRIVVSPSRG